MNSVKLGFGAGIGCLLLIAVIGIVSLLVIAYAP